MIVTYCNYGIYDDENCKSLEEGDYVSEFSYYSWNDGHKITLKNVTIIDIGEDEVTFASNKVGIITIDAHNIESWRLHMKFETSDKMDKWLENHRKDGCVSQTSAGEQFKYEFIPTSIVECQKVKCLVCGEEFLEYLD